MNSRQRVMATFRQERTEEVPVMHIGFTSAIASALLGREGFVGGGIQQWREATALWRSEEAHQEFIERSFCDAVDLAQYCEHDIMRVGYWRYNRKPTKKLDDYTYLYEHGNEELWKVLRYSPDSEQCHIYDFRPKGEMTLDDLEMQVRSAERTSENYQPDAKDFELEMRAQRLYGDEKIVRVNAVPLGIPTSTVWLEAILLRPDLVARYLDVQVSRAIRNVQFLAPFGFRYFFGGGDFASNDGPMYSPRAFRELLLPRLKQISDTCHQHGGYHLFASDGNLWRVSEDLFLRTGIDGYHEIDGRAGMDLRTLRQRFPRLTLIGNISSHVVHMASPEEVIAETMFCLEEAERSGGIVVGVSNYFVSGTPIENVEAVLNTIHQNR